MANTDDNLPTRLFSKRSMKQTFRSLPCYSGSAPTNPVPMIVNRCRKQRLPRGVGRCPLRGFATEAEDTNQNSRTPPVRLLDPRRRTTSATACARGAEMGPASVFPTRSSLTRTGSVVASSSPRLRYCSRIVATRPAMSHVTPRHSPRHRKYFLANNAYIHTRCGME